MQHGSGHTHAAQLTMSRAHELRVIDVRLILQSRELKELAG